MIHKGSLLTFFLLKTSILYIEYLVGKLQIGNCLAFLLKSMINCYDALENN